MDLSRQTALVLCSIMCAMSPIETTYIITVPGEEVSVGCPVGYKLLDGICYRLFTASKTFYEAETVCNATLGGHLAVFHSQQDYDNLVNVTGTISGGSSSFTWLGIKREAVFTNGSTYNYTIPGDDMDDVCIIIDSLGKPKGRDCKAYTRYICMVSAPCQLPGFNQGGNKCYKLSESDHSLDFRSAEMECSAEYKGHLASFHSEKEYDKLKHLARESDMWIGLLAFKFTDGSMYDFYIAGQDLKNKDQDCGGLQGNVPQSASCDTRNPFICAAPYRKVEYIVNVSTTGRADLGKLFDGDVTSCVVTTSLFTRRDVYTAGLFITSVNGTSDNDTVVLNVTFERDVICHKRKVLFSNVNTNSQCRTVKACDLINEAVTTSSCEYECPCDSTGCDVMYIDSLSDYETMQIDVCEFDILGIFEFN